MRFFKRSGSGSGFMHSRLIARIFSLSLHASMRSPIMPSITRDRVRCACVSPAIAASKHLSTSGSIVMQTLPRYLIIRAYARQPDKARCVPGSGTIAPCLIGSAWMICTNRRTDPRDRFGAVRTRHRVLPARARTGCPPGIAAMPGAHVRSVRSYPFVCPALCISPPLCCGELSGKDMVKNWFVSLITGVCIRILNRLRRFFEPVAARS